VLFALIGAGVGTPVGADVGAWLFGLLIGTAIGVFTGTAIGVVIAGTGKWAAMRAWAEDPGVVALGRREVYANGQYVRAKRRATVIAAARIEDAGHPLLVLDLHMPPRPRMPSIQQWEIVVPPAWVDEVRSFLREGSVNHE
jgi:hypothetical protein